MLDDAVVHKKYESPFAQNACRYICVAVMLYPRVIPSTVHPIGMGKLNGIHKDNVRTNNLTDSSK
ncbi:MAG: hypothetical protein ACJAUG_000763 [Halioglobus sp.]|jgi:hypothetical protein